MSRCQVPELQKHEPLTPRISVPMCLGLCAAGAAGNVGENRSRMTGRSS